MTQAHKTVGNFVALHPKCLEPQLRQYYEGYRDRIFEVRGEGPPGHVVVREVDYQGRACPDPLFPGEFMLHDDTLVTISKAQRKKILPSETPVPPMVHRSVRIRLR